MAIEFRCTCGKILSVPDDAAGRRAKCPSCGALANVPGEAPPEPPEEPGGLMGPFIDAPTPLVILAGVLALSAFTVLVLTMIAAIVMSQYIAWVFVWIPQSALGGLVAFWVIGNNPLAKKVISPAAPVVIGVNYAMFWMATASLAQGGARGLLWMFPAMIQLGVYGFLYWYFRHGGASGRPGAPKADVIDEDASSPR